MSDFGGSQSEGAGRSLLPLSRVFRPTLFSQCEPNLSREDLVAGVLPQGGFSVFYGASGSAKTFLALDMMLAIASGMEWMGREVARGAVIYVAAEGHESAMRRIKGYKIVHPDLADDELPFCVVGPPIKVTDREQIAEFIKMVKAFSQRMGVPVRAITFDTLNMSAGGIDENKSDQMGQVVQAFTRIREETGAHVIAIHHTGKNEEAGSRGHSSLKGAVDTEAEISRARDADGKPKKGEGIFKVTKQRDMDGDLTIGFKLRPVEIGFTPTGRSVTSCVIEAAEVSDEMPRKKRLASQALQILEEVRSRVDICPGGRVPRALVREAIGRWAGMKTSAATMACNRGLEALVNAGLVTDDGNHVALTGGQIGGGV